MEYPIDYRGSEVGTMNVTEDGLYWQLTAWSKTFSDQVQRLYGIEGLRSESFGVFAPNGKELSLHRRISKHACPRIPERWSAGREYDGFRPWQGTVEGQEIMDAMLRVTEGREELAVPTEPQPIPLAEYAPQMNPITLNGREYYCLPMTGGVPDAPDEDAADQDEALEAQQNSES